MIVNFKFSNFKAVKEEVCLSFEATKSEELEDYYVCKKGNKRILKMALIFGANASGKTTILEALEFVRQLVLDPLDTKDSLIDFSPFLLDQTSRNQPSNFSLEFVYKDVRYLYELEVNTSAVLAETLYFFSPNKAKVFSRTTDVDKKLAKITFGSKVKVSSEYKNSLVANTLWNNTVLGAYLKTNFDAPELQNVHDWFKHALKPIVLPSTDLFSYITKRIEAGQIQADRLITILQKADFNISEIRLEKQEIEVTDDLLQFMKLNLPGQVVEDLKGQKKINNTRLFFDHQIEGKTYPLAYEQESRGTQRYYQFSGILEMMTRTASIFPIDEIASSLHPDLLKFFLLTFLTNSEDAQLIATTHNRELFLEKDLLRNDTIWFTEKEENSGAVDLYALDDFGSETIRNTSSVYNAYKIGKLGATPQLNDYFLNFEDGQIK
ncbi:ATP-binding protein [Persicobacter psychrovividus]|uniref:Transporter n=1 Tax=Persicobacter psychrovividus TaxID=387638 RepID=A0ABM7VN80_9BACT|nr:transporter [Persicobacter psychrovividus]